MVGNRFGRFVATATLLVGGGLVGGSVAAAPSAAARGATAPTMSNCPQGMSDASDTDFRVFACDDPTGLAEEGFALGLLTALWAPMTALMGFPLPDNAVTGENGRIDVYLLDSGQALTREGQTDNLETSHGCPCSGLTVLDAINGTVSSGYILADRTLTQGPLLNSVLVHELFHVQQNAYNTAESCPNYWFTEASATWAEWYFAPKTADKMVYPNFDTFQAAPDQSLNNSAARSPYSDWMWPLYMQEQSGPQAIAQAWSGMVGQTGCTALDSAVNAVLPFSTSFDGFAVENFDSKPLNLITGKSAWPADFGPNYPDFQTASNPTAPQFPMVPPTTTTWAPTMASYPWTTSAAVNLPPLSASYYLVEPLIIGPSLEIDFSGVTAAGPVGISVVASDAQPGGTWAHNGQWKRVDLTGGDTHVKWCFGADGSVGAAPNGSAYVIIDNSSWGSAAATVSGTVTVIQKATCADRLYGKVTLATSVKSPGAAPIKQDATLKLSLVTSMVGWVPQSSSSWSETYTQTQDCGDGTTSTFNASGSGTPSFADFFTDAYQHAYADPPFVQAPLLAAETATGSWSGGTCGSGQMGVSMELGTGCPIGTGLPGDFFGAYQTNRAGVNLTCSDSGSPSPGFKYTNRLKGSLTAVNPYNCAVWTSFCSIAAP